MDEETKAAMNTDFEALRARRNAAAQEHLQKMADELDVPLQSLLSSFNPSACYCACGQGGPCEHQWNGDGWKSEDGLAWSATCSRCGTTAMSHDMRFAP